MNIGTQILSLRHYSRDFEERVRRASEIGFSGIELVHWGPNPSPNPASVAPEAARDVCEAHDVVPVASHVRAASDLEDRYDQIIDYHRRLDVSELVLSFVDESVYFAAHDPVAWAEYGRRLNRLGNRLREDGFSLGLHNHVIELLPVEGRSGLLRAFDECDIANLFWEADIGHIAAAHQSLADFIPELGRQLRIVHVKDMGSEVISIPVLESGRTFSTAEEFISPIIDRMAWEVDLGDGVIDVVAAVAESAESGVEWIFTEMHRDGLDLAKAHEYLRKNLPGS